jgi:type II secretory pathway pseudopilin PulG
MKYYNIKNHTRQSGMTLIELTVVLLVLIGLAGMLLPYVGGFMEKTHDSANSTSEHELAASISRYENQFMELPNNMDSLLDASGAGASRISYTIAGRMGGSAATNYGMAVRNLNAVDPTVAGTNAALCGSLRKAGMTKFAGMDQSAAPQANPVVGTVLAGTFNPTFNYYNTGANVDFGQSGACNGTVVELTNDQKIATSLGLSLQQIQDKRALGHTFIAAGMGTASEALGKTIQDAPVHFAKTGDANAANAYNRLLVIYEVDGNVAGTGGSAGSVNGSRTATAAFRAKMAGTAMAMHDLLGVASSLEGFYKGTAGQ